MSNTKRTPVHQEMIAVWNSDEGFTVERRFDCFIGDMVSAFSTDDGLTSLWNHWKFITPEVVGENNNTSIRVPKEGDMIYVWDDGKSTKYLRAFIGFNGEQVEVWGDTREDTYTWDNWEFPVEVKPEVFTADAARKLVAAATEKLDSENLEKIIGEIKLAAEKGKEFLHRTGHGELHRLKGKLEALGFVVKITEHIHDDEDEMKISWEKI